MGVKNCCWRVGSAFNGRRLHNDDELRDVEGGKRWKICNEGGDRCDGAVDEGNHGVGVRLDKRAGCDVCKI
jgi:hypothetical protein